MKASFVYITTGNPDEAKLIGRTLVEEKLAACVNIIQPMTSIYRWEGQIQEDTETVLIAKTTPQNVNSLSDRVKELHSYDCPCVIALPIQEGNSDYLKWIMESTQ